MHRRQVIQAGLTVPFILTFSSAPSFAYSNSNTVDSAENKARDYSALANRQVFSLSVASGDPSASGVVLWTRIDPRFHHPLLSLDVEVALDVDFQRTVLKGIVPADSISSERDYCIRLDLQGSLQPKTRYWYRFKYGDAVSPVGRCKTLPAINDSVNQLRIATLNCQEYSNGHYGVYRYLAEENDLDFVVHLGDFIYECVSGRNLLGNAFAERVINLPSGSDIAMGLDDYRALYRAYRADPFLQAAMQMHTFVCIPDDHDVVDNAYWNYARDTMGVSRHPFADRQAYPDSDQRLRRLMIEAKTAWIEYIPARVQVDWSATHPHQFMNTYRSLQIGDLAQINLIDGRSYRTHHACEAVALDSDCDTFFDKSITLLGDKQKEWLLQQLTSNTAVWNLMASQTYLGRIAVGLNSHPWAMLNVDAWDGYQYERALISNALLQQKKRNFIALSGDMHSCIVSYVKKNYENRNNADWNNNCGIEFMTPPLTSAATIDLLSPKLLNHPLKRRWLSKSLEQLLKWTNAHIEYINAREQGYAVLSLTQDKAHWRAYGVDVRVSPALAKRSILTEFEYKQDDGILRELS